MIFDVSRITQGKIELKMDSIDIAEVVAVAVVRPSVHRRPAHTLTVKLPPNPCGPATLGLAQILANLLNNAAKYTDKKGRVTLEVGERNEIVCRVRDTGIGIPLESQATIFDLFRQLGDTVERSQGGLGIGLTLVKRLVRCRAPSRRPAGDRDRAANLASSACHCSRMCRPNAKWRPSLQRRTSSPDRARHRSWWRTITSIWPQAWAAA